MDLSEYVAGLRRELATITRFAGEDVARAAEMLTEAMESSVRLTLLEVLSAAADEITTRLDEATIEVRLAGSDANFVVTVTPEDLPQPAGRPAPGAGPTAGDAPEDVARVTLRLSEQLKARVEAAAGAAGESVNAWLVHTISRALDAPAASAGRSRRSGIGQRYTGYARG